MAIISISVRINWSRSCPLLVICNFLTATCSPVFVSFPRNTSPTLLFEKLVKILENNLNTLFQQCDLHQLRKLYEDLSSKCTSLNQVKKTHGSLTYQLGGRVALILFFQFLNFFQIVSSMVRDCLGHLQ